VRSPPAETGRWEVTQEGVRVNPGARLACLLAAGAPRGHPAPP
jgi:hypothetical protein